MGVSKWHGRGCLLPSRIAHSVMARNCRQAETKRPFTTELSVNENAGTTNKCAHGNTAPAHLQGFISDPQRMLECSINGGRA